MTMKRVADGPKWPIDGLKISHKIIRTSKNSVIFFYWPSDFRPTVIQSKIIGILVLEVT